MFYIANKYRIPLSCNCLLYTLNAVSDKGRVYYTQNRIKNSKESVVHDSVAHVN